MYRGWQNYKCHEKFLPGIANDIILLCGLCGFCKFHIGKIREGKIFLSIIAGFYVISCWILQDCLQAFATQ